MSIQKIQDNYDAVVRSLNERGDASKKTIDRRQMESILGGAGTFHDDDEFEVVQKIRNEIGEKYHLDAAASQLLDAFIKRGIDDRQALYDEHKVSNGTGALTVIGLSTLAGGAFTGFVNPFGYATGFVIGCWGMLFVPDQGAALPNAAIKAYYMHKD